MPVDWSYLCIGPAFAKEEEDEEERKKNRRREEERKEGPNLPLVEYTSHSSSEPTHYSPTTPGPIPYLSVVSAGQVGNGTLVIFPFSH